MPTGSLLIINGPLQVREDCRESFVVVYTKYMLKAGDDDKHKSRRALVGSLLRMPCPITAAASQDITSSFEPKQRLLPY